MRYVIPVVVCAVVLCGSGFIVGRHQARLDCIECRIESVVTDPENTNFQGIKTPYTIVAYQPVFRTFLVPGDLGKPGQIVYVPNPRYNSASTVLP